MLSAITMTVVSNCVFDNAFTLFDCNIFLYTLKIVVTFRVAIYKSEHLWPHKSLQSSSTRNKTQLSLFTIRIKFVFRFLRTRSSKCLRAMLCTIPFASITLTYKCSKGVYVKLLVITSIWSICVSPHLVELVWERNT